MLQTLFRRFRAAHAEHLVPCTFCDVANSPPRALHRAQVLDDLIRPLVHSLAIGVHGELGSTQRVPLPLQGSDLLVHRGRQVVIAVIELLRRLDRIIGQLGELGHGFRNGLTSRLLHSNRSGSDLFDLLDRELTCGSDLRQRGHSFVPCTVHFGKRCGHRCQLPSAGAGIVAGQDD